MAFGTLGLSISEFGMMSILSEAAENFQISIEQAGHFISSYALGVFGLFGVSGPEQYLIIETAKGGEILGASSAQVAFNLGNALGALFGGLPITMGAAVQYSAVPGIFFGICGLISIYYFGKSSKSSNAIGTI